MILLFPYDLIGTEIKMAVVPISIEMEFNNVKMNNANGSSTTGNGENNMNEHISTHHNDEK